MTSVVTVNEPVTTVTVVGEDQIVVATETVTETITLGIMGPQGPAGPEGPAGPNGAGYRHDQAVPAAVWTVEHDLGFNPAGVYVEDSAGTAWDVVPVYLDENSLTLTFPGAMDGFAYFS